MEERARIALEKSIKEKWVKIVTDPTFEDRGTMNCPLCIEFGITCKGCPVMKKTGKTQCHDSPWYDWRNHVHTHRQNGYNETAHRKIGCSKCLSLAQDELVFLESLLPSKNKGFVEKRIRDRRDKSRHGFIGRRNNNTSSNRRECLKCDRRTGSAGRRSVWTERRQNG